MTILKTVGNSLAFTPKRRRVNRGLPRAASETLEERRVLSAVSYASCDAPIERGDSSAELSTAETRQDTAKSGDGPSPVLMVISNQDFWYQDYADTRASLERSGLSVIVAAKSTDWAVPQHNSGQGADGGFVRPDLALADADAADYSAIVFSGGWGMAQYQYGFEGTYNNSAYNGDSATHEVVNDLIGDFVEQDKHVAAVCYGVSVLAYARVDGESLLAGRDVTGWNGAAPWTRDGLQSSRMQIESNGATMFKSQSVGDPSTAADDVVVDGRIITAENYDSAARFGEVIAQHVIAEHRAANAKPSPVLMVIANQDFYHREYYETRESLEAAGLEVVVAAATTETATPHAISVVEGREPNVDPDLALADVDAADYSTIVFVGGYGAASYQYAFEGTYDNPAYQGSRDVKTIVNDLINDFVEQDKYVAAICNGVSVLAWARVDGVSPIAGHTVSAWADTLPTADGGVTQITRSQIEANGATQVVSGSVGDPTTATDDVIVDGNIITAENYDSAYRFGEVLAGQLIRQAQEDLYDQVFADLAVNG
ncbi:MAG: DJ-1/PfpI family protein [Planctomycetaceae bacterium]|nr:DJ-1/PfpI family protein [Planctomycetaceae bacterium]